MTRIDIFSGFLGAGKTTLIRKLIAEGYKGEKLVLIENEFGDIAIDGGVLKDAGVEINELNSGCICCTLVGDFTKALQQVMEQFKPDRIIVWLGSDTKESDLTKGMLSLKEYGVEYRFDKELNLKPHKKYIYAIQEFPDDIREYSRSHHRAWNRQ